MDPKIQALFDENANPTHASIEAAHATLAQAVELATAIEHQVAHYHALRRAIKLDANVDRSPASLVPTIENFRQRIDDVGSGAQTFLDAAEILSVRMGQLDRAMNDAKVSIAHHETQVAKFHATGAPVDAAK